MDLETSIVSRDSAAAAVAASMAAAVAAGADGIVAASATISKPNSLTSAAVSQKNAAEAVATGGTKRFFR